MDGIMVLVMMQRSGIDWASVLHPWSVKQGHNPSSWMLMVPLSHANTPVKK